MNWLAKLQQERAIAVVRVSHRDLGLQMARAAAAGGITLLEIAWQERITLDLIAQLRQELPHCCIGIGTLLTAPQLREAVAAGAQFGFSPHTDPELLAQAATLEIPLVPGALSPTEIVTAWRAGAMAVKVFPIQAVGGAAYVEALRGPLGQIPLIPTGGVTLDNAEALLKAGAIAVGLSGQLFPKAWVQGGNWGAIAQRARDLRQRLEAVR